MPSASSPRITWQSPLKCKISPVVMPKMIRSGGGGRGDYKHMYFWIVTNIEYTLDSYLPILPEPMNETVKWQDGFLRMPAETLRDRAGDCEDMSALLPSMLLNYNGGQHPVWMIGIEISRPEPARHIAIAFPVAENRLTMLDPTAR